MNIKSFSIILINLLLSISCDINIHIIPHTHLDPGWLKTPEEYYVQEGIKNIFGTVLDSLTKHNEKTFIINELYYFKKWYQFLDESKKESVKKLISEKRLEFVFCGYTVNDEATPIYYDIVDNIRIGLQFLLEEFNVIPKSAFFLDSFGHNSGNAHIVSQMGFDSLVLGRMHNDYLEKMKNEKLNEFYWDMFGNGNSNKTLLTHIMALHYGYTLFLPELEDNTESVMPQFIEKLQQILKGIKHKNILFLFGDDFKFINDHLFSCIDTLIKQFKNKQSDARTYFQTREKINIFYSTPEKYFSYMKQELEENNQQLETVTHKDFYPLRTDCFWTGYFTSRPYLKGMIRKTSNAFYTFSKYFAFNRFMNNLLNNEIYNDLNELREVVALNQHHDAITGTCKQYVATDYISKMRSQLKKVEKDFTINFEEKYRIKIGKINYNNFITKNEGKIDDYTTDIDKNGNIKIGIYNPIMTNEAGEVNHLLINLEFSYSEYEYEIEGIKSNFFCVDEKGIKQPELFMYKNKCFMNFFLDFKKGEEFTYISLKKTENKIQSDKYIKFNIKDNNDIELVKDMTNIKSLSFNPSKFNFDIKYLDSNEQISEINFSYFDGLYYVNAGSCTDGAYIFSPYNRYPDPILIDYDNSFYIKGDIGITFLTRNKYSSFTIFTIFYEPFFAKVEHIFDNLNNNYFLNRFSFAYNFVLKTNLNNLDNNGLPIFYTDANGLEPMKRIVDNFDYEETTRPKTGGNFYPVTSYISIRDENGGNHKVTLFTDRPEGGSGFLPGSLSLTLQRKSYGTDNKGLIENMKETESMERNDFKTTHLIVFGNSINKSTNNENKDMEHKTNLLNLVYNYMNKATLHFKINESENDLNDKFKKENELINNSINKYLTYSWDIRANYEIINDNLIIGQYFRYNNYIFNAKNSIIDDKIFGLINLNFESDVKFKIYYDKTGINYKIRDNKMFSDDLLNQFKEPKNQSISLNFNEFIFIYFYFGN